MPDEVIAALATYVGADPLATLAEIKGGLWGKVARTVAAPAAVRGMESSAGAAIVAATAAAGAWAQEAALRIMYIM